MTSQIKLFGSSFGPFNVHPKVVAVCGSWNDLFLQTTPFGIDETRETHTHKKKEKIKKKMGNVVRGNIKPKGNNK